MNSAESLDWRARFWTLAVFVPTMAAVIWLQTRLPFLQSPTVGRAVQLTGSMGPVLCMLAIVLIERIRDRALTEMTVGRSGRWLLVAAVLLGWGYRPFASVAYLAQAVAFLIGPMRFQGAVAAAVRRWQSRTTSLIIQPPGSRARSVLEFLFGQRACSRVFEPIIADMQHEWFDAMKDSREGAARLAVLRGCIALCFAVVMLLTSKIGELWRATR